MAPKNQRKNTKISKPKKRVVQAGVPAKRPSRMVPKTLKPKPTQKPNTRRNAMVPIATSTSSTAPCLGQLLGVDIADLRRYVTAAHPGVRLIERRAPMKITSRVAQNQVFVEVDAGNKVSRIVCGQQLAFRPGLWRTTPAGRRPVSGTKTPTTAVTSCLGGLLNAPLSKVQKYIATNYPAARVIPRAAPMKITSKVQPHQIYVEVSNGRATRFVCGSPAYIYNASSSAKPMNRPAAAVQLPPPTLATKPSYQTQYITQPLVNTVAPHVPSGAPLVQSRPTVNTNTNTVRVVIRDADGFEKQADVPPQQVTALPSGGYLVAGQPVVGFLPPPTLPVGPAVVAPVYNGVVASSPDVGYGVVDPAAAYAPATPGSDILYNRTTNYYSSQPRINYSQGNIGDGNAFDSSYRQSNVINFGDAGGDIALEGDSGAMALSAGEDVMALSPTQASTTPPVINFDDSEDDDPPRMSSKMKIVLIVCSVLVVGLLVYGYRAWKQRQLKELDAAVDPLDSGEIDDFGDDDFGDDFGELPARGGGKF